MKPKSKGKRKLRSRWESGIFVGVQDPSQELITGTPDGAVKAREFRRKGCEEQRWNLDELGGMQ